jgi:serine phosphatase RsbU (regulator of sigma subunit)
MPVTETSASFDAIRRRHPRVLGSISWLRSHPVLCGSLGSATVAVLFVLDMSVPGLLLSGFYIAPLFFLALSVNWRAVAFAVAVCVALSAFVFVWEDSLSADHGLILLYWAMIGSSLVVLSYLLQRLYTMTDYAELRAQLSEAGADVLSGRSGDDLDELLEYALERLGEQLDATNGVLLLLEDGAWVGRAGFGLGVDAREVAAQYGEVPLGAQALLTDSAVSRDFTAGDPSPLAPVAARVRLERTLVIPVRSLERDVGVLVYNRPQEAGEYSGEQIALAEGLARYIGVTVDNVRLLLELNTRRRDLELVRDSSLDFAQSIDMDEVLEAVVARLISALDMHACDIYEVDIEAGVMRILVSYDDGGFDTSEFLGREYPIDYFATSAMAIRSRRPVVVTSVDDPRLNDPERDLMKRWGHNTELIIPLRIREHVAALVELLDDREGRDFSDEEVELARSICRFAALAIDKARLFDQQRATAERRDRLARRLQRLQSFAVDLNQRLDRADLQEVLDEVTRAAVDLLHVRAAAVMAGSGDYVGVRSLAVAGVASASVLAAAEADLLARCSPALTPAGEDFAGVDNLTVSPGDDETLLFAPLEGEAAPQPLVLVVADKQQGEFDDEDRLLLATLAAQLNASMHNAIAYQREHVIAETFQQALLMEPPAIPGIEVGVRYRAATDSARIGGDFYDLVSLGPGKLGVIVGDVCGKSLAAAAQSAVVRYMLRAYAAEGSPGEALSRLNSAVITQTPNQPFVTLVLAYVDVARHMFECAVAGHPRPVVLAGLGEFPMPGEGNVPVGIFRGATYPTNRAVLPDDSCVVFYTDGITDARRDGVLFGEERLREAVRANLPLDAQALADALLEAVKEFSGGVLADDCAIVVVKLP